MTTPPPDPDLARTLGNLADGLELAVAALRTLAESRAGTPRLDPAIAGHRETTAGRVPVVGRCGATSPLITPAALVSRCALLADHRGWHRAADGAEWGARA